MPIGRARRIVLDTDIFRMDTVKVANIRSFSLEGATRISIKNDSILRFFVLYFGLSEIRSYHQIELVELYKTH